MDLQIILNSYLNLGRSLVQAKQSEQALQALNISQLFQTPDQSTVQQDKSSTTLNQSSTQPFNVAHKSAKNLSARSIFKQAYKLSKTFLDRYNVFRIKFKVLKKESKKNSDSISPIHQHQGSNACSWHDAVAQGTASPQNPLDQCTGQSINISMASNNLNGASNQVNSPNGANSNSNSSGGHNSGFVSFGMNKECACLQVNFAGELFSFLQQQRQILHLQHKSRSHSSGKQVLLVPKYQLKSLNNIMDHQIAGSQDKTRNYSTQSLIQGSQERQNGQDLTHSPLQYSFQGNPALPTFVPASGALPCSGFAPTALQTISGGRAASSRQPAVPGHR